MMKKITFLLMMLMVSVGFSQPTNNAATPPERNANDVLSIFSGEYDNVSPINYNPNWGQSGFGSANTSFDPGTGNIILAYPNFNYQGIDFGNPQGSTAGYNVSNMEFLHVDIWTANATTVRVVPIQPGVAEAGVLLNVTQNSWASIDIPLSQFPGYSFANIFQLKFDQGNGNVAIYLDNIYFWKSEIDPATDASLTDIQVDGTSIDGFGSATTNYTIGLPFGASIPQITAAPTTNPNATAVITQATALPGNATVVVTAEDGVTTKTYTVSFVVEGPTTPAPTPPARPAENVLSIYSDAYEDITIEALDFGLCGNSPAVEEVTIAGNPTLRYLGPGCQGINFENNRLDASTFTNLHFDFYTDDAIIGAVFNIKLVDWAGNTTEAGSTGLEINFNAGTSTQLVENQWVSVDVDITALGGMIGGNLTRSDIAQIHITSNLPNAWYDNFYLYKDPGTCDDGIQNQGETGIDCGGPCAPCVGAPSVAAPTPPVRPAQDVISIYSDAYDDITIGNFDFGLCGNNPATEEVLIADNPTILYSGPGCQGIDFQNNRQNASEFTRLHFDFYTDDADLIGKVFNIKLVDWAGNPTDTGATGLEVNFNGGSNPPLVANQWISIDVNITNFGGPVEVGGNLTRNDIAQIHITSNLNNVWYDNLYLHKNTVLSTDEFSSNNFKVYPNPSNFEWNVEANSTVKSLSLVNILGKQVLKLEPNSSSFAIDNTSLATGLYFATIATENGSSVVKLIKN